MPDKINIKTIEQLKQAYNLDGIKKLQRAVELQKETITKVDNEQKNIIQSIILNMEGLESQSDMSLWFFSGIPALENSPAIDFENNEDHLGDLYYDRETGNVYKFVVNESVYNWEINQDNNLIQSMAITNASIDTSDNQRKVFFNTPIPIYNNGDWWIKEEGLYICQISKNEGTFDENDFIIASRYTLGTIAIKTDKQLKIISGKVTTIEDGIDKIEDRIEDNRYYIDESGQKHLISTATAEFKKNINGFYVDLKRSNNNILQGTHFKTLDSWLGNYPIKPYKQGITFPTNPSYEDYFYNTQTGQMWQYDISNTWIRNSITRKSLEETINPPLNFMVIENNDTKAKALSQKYGRLFSGPSESNNIAAISHKLEVINNVKDYMVFQFQFLNNINCGTAQIDIIEHTTDILDNTNIISDRVFRKSISYNAASEDGYVEVIIPIIKQTNSISNAFINSDENTPPVDTSKIWLLRLNSNQARVLKYNFDIEQWIDYNDLFKPIRDVELGKYWVRTHPRLYTSTSNQNMDARYITVGLSLGYTIIEHQSETAPLDPLPYTAWGDTLTDEVKVPVFENKNFTGNWEVLNQTLSDALNNDPDHPFLYASGYYEFYDLKLEYGNVATEWTGNENEIFGANHAMTERGYVFNKGDRKTILDDDEVKSTKNGETKWELTDDGMFSKTAKTEQLDINGFITKTINVDFGYGVRNVCISYKI